MTPAERAVLIAIGRNVYQESMALPTARIELVDALVAIKREAGKPVCTCLAGRVLHEQDCSKAKP